MKLFFIVLCIGLLSFLMIPVLQIHLPSRSFQGAGPRADSRLQVMGWGDNPADPFHVSLDYFYTNWSDYFSEYETRYIAFDLQAYEIYFILLDPASFWYLELYDDSEFSILLGTPYYVYYGKVFHEYLFFSPNRTGTYYIKLQRETPFLDLTFAVLTADSYSFNTSRVVIIGRDTHPIQIFQFDTPGGNFSSSTAALYAYIERGWNYVVFPEAYNQFPTEGTFPLGSGSYGVVIEESCEFLLTSYPPRNSSQEDPASDPPENSTEDDMNISSILDNVTPVFGIGILVGILVIYKMKKPK